MSEHLECIVELKDGETEWFDPVNLESVFTKQGFLIVITNYDEEYHFDIDTVNKYSVRPYNPHTTYYSIDRYDQEFGL